MVLFRSVLCRATLIPLLWLLLGPTAGVTIAAAAEGFSASGSADFRYAIQLRSGPKPTQPAQLPKLAALKEHWLYELKSKRDGRVVYRLRLGFFSSPKDGNKLRKSLEKDFPGNWVIGTKAAEWKLAKKNRIKVPGSRKLKSTKVAKKAKASKRSKSKSLANRPFAIQLRRSAEPIDPKTVPKLRLFKDYQLYVAELDRKGRTLYQLRLGFFSAAREAIPVQQELNKLFPGNWVVRTSDEERARWSKHRIKPRLKSPEKAKRKALKIARRAAKKAAERAAREAANAAKLAAEAEAANKPYALQLLRSSTPIAPSSVPKLKIFRKQLLYVVESTKAGKKRYELRLGFFANAKEATALQKTLETDFPGNWVVRVSEAEQAKAQGRLIKPKKSSRPKSGKSPKKLFARKSAVVRPYVLQLRLSNKPIDPASVPKLDLYRGNTLYVVTTPQGADTRYELRLGFFASAKEAAALQKQLKATFPDNWVVRASKAERDQASSNRIKPRLRLAAVPKPKKQKPPKSAKPAEKEKSLVNRAVLSKPLPEEEGAKVKELMKRGRNAITRGDQRTAIRIFTKVLEYPEFSGRANALEFLGLARERNGQSAHAIARYREYLVRYPEGRGASRVQQRLAGLETAPQTPRARLDSGKSRASEVQWEVYGGLSQFYRQEYNGQDVTSQALVESILTTDLDLNTRRRGDDWTIRTRFSGDNQYNFDQAMNKSSWRISTAQIDAQRRSHPAAARFGRQTQTTGGVLGRFDGLVTHYRVASKTQLNFVAGFPVDFATADRVVTSKHFFGLNMDLGTFAEVIDMNLFLIQQTTHAVVDRRATGIEMRYFRPDRSVFAVLDYDIMFGALNTFLLLANWTLADQSTINLSLDHRRTPVLTTSNGLQGQSVNGGPITPTNPPEDRVDNLVDRVGQSRAVQLANDRTPISRTLTLGYSHPMDERVRINGDITLTTLSDTIGDVGIDPVPGTGVEYFFTGQAVVNELFQDGDITILSIRYGRTSASSSTSIQLDSRYPKGNGWRLNPRVRTDIRNNFNDQSQQIAVRPTMRADLRVIRQLNLEFEGGGDWSHTFLPGPDEATWGYNMSLGFRMDF